MNIFIFIFGLEFDIRDTLTKTLVKFRFSFNFYISIVENVANANYQLSQSEQFMSDEIAERYWRK
jgi:hypothetical protein